MIEEIICLLGVERPKFTVNNAVNFVVMADGDPNQELKGIGPGATTTKFFQKNDNVLIKGIGMRLPYSYCLADGGSFSTPCIHLFWINEDGSDLQDIGNFKIPIMGEEIGYSFFTPFHAGVPTAFRNLIRASLSFPGSVSMVFNPATAFPDATVLRMEVWARIQHNLPLLSV